MLAPSTPASPLRLENPNGTMAPIDLFSNINFALANALFQVPSGHFVNPFEFDSPNRCENAETQVVFSTPGSTFSLLSSLDSSSIPSFLDREPPQLSLQPLTAPCDLFRQFADDQPSSPMINDEPSTFSLIINDEPSSPVVNDPPSSPSISDEPYIIDLTTPPTTPRTQARNRLEVLHFVSMFNDEVEELIDTAFRKRLCKGDVKGELKKIRNSYDERVYNMI